jgi:hypothetical protein
MGIRLDRPRDDPWKLKTPPGTSAYTMHTDAKDGRKVLVCTVGNTILHYDARCIDDLYAMLKEAGDWVELGGADEQKPAKEGTVEGWGRSEANPSSRGEVRRASGGAYGAPPTSSVGLAEQEVRS